MNKSTLIMAPIILVIGILTGYWFASSQQTIEQPAIVSSEKKFFFTVIL